MKLLKEFCAENMTLVPAAVSAGAQRIELCDNLAAGGTSPSYGVIKAAVAFAREHGADIRAMARPRGGDFVYDERERQIMCDDIACARQLGASGVVFGCVRPGDDGTLTIDEELTKTLVACAKDSVASLSARADPVEVTFHMAFDALDHDEQFRAIDLLASLGVERILTHGGPLETPLFDNVAHLQELVAYAGERIIILPGGGITWKNAEELAALLGVHEVHGSKVVRL